MKRINIKVNNFSLDKTLKSEQCVADLFLLNESNNSWITYLPIQNTWSKIILRQTTKDNLEIKFNQPKVKEEQLISKIKHIFSLNDNYGDLLKKYKNDKYLMNIYKSSYGIRIMNDINKEFRIIESILTQNTSVKMVKTMQKNLFLHYGKRIKIDNENIHIYPDMNKIATDSIESIKDKVRCGYRAEYLKTIAQSIISKKLDTDKVSSLETNHAREYLLNFKGIGPKVADLILMYGFSKKDVFPADVWIRKTLGKVYFNDRIPTVNESIKFAKEYFGNYASLINLMIFYHERKDKTEFINTNVWI